MGLAAKKISGPPPLSPRQELLKIQQEIFRHNQELINNSTWVRERAFARYEKDYRRQVRDYESVSNIDELVAAAQSAQIVYLGDYHTNKQSQRTALRLLKLLVAATERPIILAIELVQTRFQKKLDAYLKEEMDEFAFLKAIQLKKYWYFDLWENFKPIFDFAIYHKMPAFGLEANLAGSPTLAERDQMAAKVIDKICRKNPEALVFVLAGDLHMAPNHLPRAVQARARKDESRSSVIVYQNSESIYWKLAEAGLEDKAEVVRINPQSFCIINTPPVICQQSYLNWLEHEEGEIDWVDARTSFLELVRRIAGFMELETGKKAEEVEVFTSGDLSSLARLEDDPEITRQEKKIIRRQIGASESYYFAKKKWVYLSNLSLNHAGEEAAHFLKHIVAGNEFPRKVVDAFYANVMHEALGFFGSKIINHKRKCLHEAQFVGLLQYVENAKSRKGRELEYEIARLVLEHKKLEMRGRLLSHQKIFSRREKVFFGVTHALGYMLGDRIYYAMVQEKISKEEIRDLFKDKMAGEGAPALLYLNWVRKVGRIKIPKRV